jgi:hypothetical protein
MSGGARERRACERFLIPGAVVDYRREGFLRPGKYSGESSPLFDISRGGLRFLCDTLLRAAAKVTVRITLPGEDSPLVLRGSVRWATVHAGKSYKYQVGVQFAPYGNNRGDNDPSVLQQIIALETRALKK